MLFTKNEYMFHLQQLRVCTYYYTTYSTRSTRLDDHWKV